MLRWCIFCCGREGRNDCRNKSARIGIIIDEALEELEKYNEQLKHALATSYDGENVSRYGKSSLPASNFASLIAEIDKIHEDAEHPMNDLTPIFPLLSGL